MKYRHSYKENPMQYDRVQIRVSSIKIRLDNIRIRVFLNLNIRTLGIIILDFIYLYFYLKTIWLLIRRQEMI